MPDLALTRRDLGAAGFLRLDTLVRLRWLAVLGQGLAVLAVHHGLGFALPIGPALAVVALAGLLNLVLRWRYPLAHRLEADAATALLAFDVLQLAALLYLTGGLENPFASLFLAPVMISATVLPPRRTLVLGALAALCASALGMWHEPLPWASVGGAGPRLPRLYVAGVWASILLGLAFMGAYAWRVAEEARQLADALSATELVLAREQHLSRVDGLAAAAAHELGTPLATIALVAKELQREVPEGSPLREDVVLIGEQAARCRSILATIAQLGEGEEGAGPLGELSLQHLLEEISAPHRPFEVAITVLREGRGPEPAMARNPGLLYGLGNLVENAVDYARAVVVIEAGWDAREVRLSIRDDGPGFAPEVLGRLGEPYVTTRARRPAPAAGEDGTGFGGLGLGLFIAKTLLERSGARFSARNLPAPESGAVVEVRWPRAAFEAGTRAARPAPRPARVAVLY